MSGSQSGPTCTSVFRRGLLALARKERESWGPVQVAPISPTPHDLIDRSVHDVRDTKVLIVTYNSVLMDAEELKDQTSALIDLVSQLLA